MRMLYSGPVKWAEGLSFNPYFNDLNTIAIMIDTSFKKDQEDYADLIQWMEARIPSSCLPIESKDADILWNNMTM